MLRPFNVTRACGATVTRFIATVLVSFGLSFGACVTLRAQDSPFRRGDVNADSLFDVSDAIGVLLGIFRNPASIRCRDAADIDDSGTLEVTDGILALSYLFRGGSPPRPPFPGCGDDPSADALDCESHAPCSDGAPLVPEFEARVIADRTSGVAGTVFRLRAEVVEEGVEVARFGWQLDEGAAAFVGEAIELSFDEPGFHAVQLTVRDTSGRESIAEAFLSVFDDTDPPEVTRAIEPASGTPATPLRIDSPLLLDPLAHVQVRVGDTPLQDTFRPALGFVRAAIPIEAGGPDPFGFDGTDIEVVLVMDGVDADTFTFRLEPLPESARPTGETLAQLCEILVPSLDAVGARIDDQVAAVGATEEERAVLFSLVEATRDEIAGSLDELERVLALLGAEELESLEIIARANGLDVALEELREFVDGGGDGLVAGGVGLAFFAPICALNDGIERLRRASVGLGVACGVVGVLSDLPVVGFAFKIAGRICSLVSDALDVTVEALSGFALDIGVFSRDEEVRLTVSAPACIAAGGSGEVGVSVPIREPRELCEDEYDFREIARERIFDTIEERIIANDGMGARWLRRERLGARIIRKAIGVAADLLAGIVDESRVRSRLDSVRARLCGRLASDGSGLALATDNLATFSVNPLAVLEAGPGAGTLTCPEGNPEIPLVKHTIFAAVNICGTELHGTTTVICTAARYDLGETVELAVDHERALELRLIGDELDPDEPLEWTSSDSAVVMVDETGRVRALSAGEARISVRNSCGVSGSVRVEVFPNVEGTWSFTETVHVVLDEDEEGDCDVTGLGRIDVQDGRRVEGVGRADGDCVFYFDGEEFPVQETSEFRIEGAMTRSGDGIYSFEYRTIDDEVATETCIHTGVITGDRPLVISGDVQCAEIDEGGIVRSTSVGTFQQERTGG